MKTERENLIEKVRSFLIGAAHDAVEETKTKNGASSTFYLNIDINISIVLAWVDGFDKEDDKFSDGTWRLEASVRLRDSSYFVEDWDYINEGCFDAIYPADEEDNFQGVSEFLVDMMLNCGYLHPQVFIHVPELGDLNVFFYADDVAMEYRHNLPDERDLVHEWWYYHGWNRDRDSAKRLKVWAEYVAEYYMAYVYCDELGVNITADQIFQALIKED